MTLVPLPVWLPYASRQYTAPSTVAEIVRAIGGYGPIRILRCSRLATAASGPTPHPRVSGLDQNTQRQLEGTDLDWIFTDRASGKDTNRPQLDELLWFIRDGDTLVVHSMDRLARNLDDLRSLVQKLTNKGVRIEFLKEPLVFTGEDSPMANLMLRHGCLRRIRTGTDR
jgi:hypothetical protein